MEERFRKKVSDVEKTIYCKRREAYFDSKHSF